MLKIVDNYIFAIVCIRSQAEEENLHSALFFFAEMCSNAATIHILAQLLNMNCYRIKMSKSLSDISHTRLGSDTNRLFVL